jgi:hypothetical protein
VLVNPQANTFGLTLLSTADGTRPVAAMGTAITPAQNAYGTYASMISGGSLTDDVYEIEININTVGISAAARDCVVSLGLDPAGGTTYTSICDLLVGPASPYNILGGGTWFKFPYFIRAGTSIGLAAAVNSATLTAINGFVRVKCRPSHPEQIMIGRYIDQFGVTFASSSGTALTEGGASEGAYVQVGAALTRPIWYLEFGYGCNNATMSAQLSEIDVAVGDATNKLNVINGAAVTSNASEQQSKSAQGRYCVAATGALLYGRAQSSAGNTGSSIALYGVGG